MHGAWVFYRSDGSVKRAAVGWRRLRWPLAIIAVTVEMAAFVAWRVILHRRGR